jgi:hypothetical protein
MLPWFLLTLGWLGKYLSMLSCPGRGCCSKSPIGSGYCSNWWQTLALSCGAGLQSYRMQELWGCGCFHSDFKRRSGRPGNMIPWR